MNRRKLTDEAAQWFMRCQQGPLDARQAAELIEWLGRSEEHVAAYLDVAHLHAWIEQRELAERTPETFPRKLIAALDATLRGGARARETANAAKPALSPFLISRRALLAGAGAASGLGLAGLMSVMGRTPQNVIESGHVRRERLAGGVMHASRDSAYQIEDQRHDVQTVRLISGQAAFHLWKSLSVTVVKASLCEIVARTGRFALAPVGSLQVITVAEGVIRVIVSAGAASREVMLKAGERLTIRPGDSSPKPVAVPDAERAFTWTAGELSFANETIREAAAIFNRFNQVQIEVSPEIADYSVGYDQGPLNNPQFFAQRFATRRGLMIRKEQGGKVIRILSDDGGPATRSPR